MLRGRVDPKKEEQERLQGFLLEMLKEEENKYCADCQAKTPRWAAWNLGIFICIRCAGIHRNLGVHISKVRSVNLDSWTAEQVQTMRVMGNEKARQVYEHDLPPQFRRPTSDNQMEQFIRSKYEQKRYMMRDFQYPRVDVNDLPRSLAHTSSKKAINPVVNISKSSISAPTQSAPTTTVNDLLDFSSSAPSTQEASKTANLIDDLAGLSMETPAPTNKTSSNDDFDDFGSFVSASSAKVTNTNTTSNSGFADFSNLNTATETTQSGGIADLASIGEEPPKMEQKRSNADILSLFGTSSSSTEASNGPMLVAPGGFTAFGLQAAPNAQQPQAQSSLIGGTSNGGFAAFQNTSPATSTTNNMFGGLGGINFGAPSAPAPAPVQQFGGMSSIAPMTNQVPQSPTNANSGFSIPSKSNAFADLSLGKVMKTNYGQSALNPNSSSSRVSPQPQQELPKMGNEQQKAPVSSTNNDLFDMFAPAPPPMPVTVNASSGLDDLLGL